MEPSSGPRLPGIEGARAVAACSILVWHAWLFSSPDGPPDAWLLSRVMPQLAFGVTLFFTLSGFLLYLPYAASVLRERPSPSARRYFRNRALRILPAYWFVLLVSSLALGTVLVRESDELVPGRLTSFGDLLRTGAFVQNYSPETLGIGIGPAWSLAVEVVFYVSLPVLALLAGAIASRRTTGSGRRAAVLLPPALLLCLGLSGKAVAAHMLPGVPSEWGTTWHSVVELSFWGMADLFAFGMALAVLYVEVEDRRIRLASWWRPATAVAVVSACAVVAVTTPWGEQMSYHPVNTVMAVVCALALALVVLPAGARDRSRPLLVRVLEQPAVVAVGVVSYSVFLWQVPVAYFLREHELVLAGVDGFLVNAVVLFTITLGLSILTYRYVEAPALRLKGRRRAAAGAPTLVPDHQESAAP